VASCLKRRHTYCERYDSDQRPRSNRQRSNAFRREFSLSIIGATENRRFSIFDAFSWSSAIFSPLFWPDSKLAAVQESNARHLKRLTYPLVTANACRSTVSVALHCRNHLIGEG